MIDRVTFSKRDSPWKLSNLKKKIISYLPKGIGFHLKFDQNTMFGEFGRYAHVLVKIDLAGALMDSIILIRKEDAVIVYLHHENLRNFCTFYCSIGHLVADCRQLEWTVPVRKEKTPPADQAKQFFFAKEVVHL